MQVTEHVWQHSAQKGGALLTLIALANHADDHGRAWPSIPRLAQMSRLTPRQIHTVLYNHEHGVRRGVATGFASLDQSFGGFDIGHLTMLAARKQRAVRLARAQEGADEVQKVLGRI